MSHFVCPKSARGYHLSSQVINERHAQPCGIILDKRTCLLIEHSAARQTLPGERKNSSCSAGVIGYDFASEALTTPNTIRVVAHYQEIREHHVGSKAAPLNLTQIVQVPDASALGGALSVRSASKVLSTLSPLEDIIWVRVGGDGRLRDNLDTCGRVCAISLPAYQCRSRAYQQLFRHQSGQGCCSLDHKRYDGHTSCC